ncbi:ABC transporter permease [Maridesulfovibrio salexigens]|uniref:Binding-protein-dependent transport systems inner membrane component n=1 Tax=Maridesulfovibrio salexigens (strain ATCC 14822 / DSM 2638 / NCIMB 8403 / VKM B-1763) TaxID=526222 RepID=C6BS40_MARSD|nr:iron ABC transporter permease [Maridesulfovibrio salexigens]ACS81423.1 binding-protein-dependent transport systems inner membrane component [Maridesulfovibrio salexigens DSM 2638]
MFLNKAVRAGVIPARDSGLAIFLPVFLSVCILSVMPTIRLLVESVVPDGTFSLEILREIMDESGTWKAFRHTIFVGGCATMLATLLGSAMGLLVGLTDIRFRKALTFCFMMPMMIPPQITALSWIQLFGPSSVLLNFLGIAPAPGTPHPMYSPFGIILLLGIQQAPLIFLSLKAGLAAMPREMVEAARVCGAGNSRVLRDIVLPLMTPALTAGMALAFVSCIGNFGIPAMLGIPAGYTVLTTLIYQRLAMFGPEVIAEAASLSVLISMLALFGILLQSYMLNRRDYRLVGAPSELLKYRLGKLRSLAEFASWMVILLVLVIPLCALFFSSLIPSFGVELNAETMTFSNYFNVLFKHDATTRAFINSFSLAGGAALILCLVGIPLGYFLVWQKNSLLRFMSPLMELPYALPGVVLAIGCILLFLKPVFGVSIYGTVWIILVAYLARFLPMGLRPVIGGFTQTDRVLEEAAQMCGAGFFRRMKDIIVPLIMPAAATGGLFIFLAAFNELTVSVLLWSSGSETLGVVIFNLDESGNAVLASAVSILVIVAVLLLMTVLSFLGRKAPKGVIPWQG